MPEHIGKRILTPNQSYDIQMIIGDLDYSNDLIGINIVSSILTAYQIISIDLVLDQQDILLKRLYGKDPIKLVIRFLGHDGNTRGHELEKITFDLMQISDVSVVRTSAQNVTGKHRELCKVSIVTVPRKPFVTMMSMVNDVFYGKTPYDILSSLIKSSKANVNFDSNNINKNPIDQALIPPMTLYRAISYIDYQFGIYNGGVSNQGFCQYDNTVCIFNLNKKVNSAVAFTVTQVALDADNEDLFKDMYDGTKYITYTNLDSEYNGNSKICNIPKNITYTTKPTNSLYGKIKLDFFDICKSNGVYTGKNSDIYHDDILDKRELLITNHTGADLTTAFAKANMARMTIDFSIMTVYINRNIQIANLLRVGEAVALETKTVDYVDLSGNYILKASDITFNKDTMNWMSYAKLVLNRTNKTRN